VRRLVALLVIALVGATLYGFSSYSSGLTVNGTTVSGSTFRAELTAISSNPTLDCYLSALNPSSYAPGAGGASISAAGASAWANLRVEGLAIDQFATKNLKYHPDAVQLAKARASLESELSSAEASAAAANPQNGSSCPGSSTQALNEMPTEMRNFEIASQAASLYLVSKLDTTVPLTVTSMKKYYLNHLADFQTICVSVAVVDPTEVTAFDAGEKAGMSVAALASKYSADPSAKKGGAYGCFDPSSSSYSGVRTATASTPLNTFPTTPEQITYDNQTAALFVAPTSRTTTPFASAEGAILSDLENANATKANAATAGIVYHSAVSIDPSVGRWGLGTTGASVFAPALPSNSVVGSSTITALGVGASTYK
jgi:hypothetical protein